MHAIAIAQNNATGSAVRVAVDLAKDVFELAFADAGGRIVERRRLSRAAFARAFDNRPVLSIVMSARPAVPAGRRRRSADSDRAERVRRRACALRFGTPPLQRAWPAATRTLQRQHATTRTHDQTRRQLPAHPAHPRRTVRTAGRKSRPETGKTARPNPGVGLGARRTDVSQQSGGGARKQDRPTSLGCGSPRPGLRSQPPQHASRALNPAHNPSQTSPLHALHRFNVMPVRRSPKQIRR